MCFGVVGVWGACTVVVGGVVVMRLLSGGSSIDVVGVRVTGVIAGHVVLVVVCVFGVDGFVGFGCCCLAGRLFADGGERGGSGCIAFSLSALFAFASISWLLALLHICFSLGYILR